VGGVGGAGDEVFANEDVPAGEGVAAGAEAGGGDGIGDEDGAVEADAGEPVFQHEEGHMHAVRDEAEPEAIMQAEGALDDVVMAVHLDGAAVAEMREHGQSGIAGGIELVERGIAVTGGDGDALRSEEGGGFAAVIVLGGEGDELGEASGGREESLGVVHIGRFYGVGRVGTDVAFDRIDERPFNMNASDDAAGEFVFFAQFDQFADAALQGGNFIGDEGGEDVIAPVFNEAFAGVVEGFGGEIVTVEVGASIAVDLEIEGIHAEHRSGDGKGTQAREVMGFGMNVTRRQGLGIVVPPLGGPGLSRTA
jgi:hypothetical protein